MSEGHRQIALKDGKDHHTALTIDRDVQIAGGDQDQLIALTMDPILRIAGQDEEIKLFALTMDRHVKTEGALANGTNDRPGARGNLRTERRGHSIVTAISGVRADSRTGTLQEGLQESLLEDAKLKIGQIAQSGRGDLGPQGMRLHRSHVGVLTETVLRATSAVMHLKRRPIHLLLQRVPQ